VKARILVGLMSVLGTPSALRATGDVVAFVEDGVLVIEGDDGDDKLEVSETPEPGSGSFLIVGIDGTLVNGLESDTVSGSIKDIVLDLGDGVNESEFSDIEIPGDFVVCGGEGFNEFEVKDCTIGGCVEVENGDGDTKTKFNGCEIGDDVEIRNHDGFDEISFKECEIADCVEIENGDGNELDEGSDTGLKDGTLVGGDVHITNRDGLDEYDQKESEILGSLSIRNHGGGSSLDIDTSAVGGDIEFDSRSGFDFFNLDDAEIGGDVEVRFKSGGSEFITETSTGVGGVTIHGSLFVEGKGEYLDTVTLDVLNVEDEVEIQLGPGDDFITVLNSTFQDDLDVDGHSGNDTFTDGGGNALLGDSDIANIEVTLP
jgi:hypothetical protein